MVGYSSLDLQDFKLLFRGNESQIGRTNLLGGTEVSGKVKSKSWLDKRPLNIDDLQKHINGRVSIGIAPLTENNTCYFGAIDIDEYSGQCAAIVKAIYEADIPLRPFHSKSGGLHLYIFFDDEDGVPAHDVRKLLTLYCKLFNLPKQTEIFPKQINMDGVVNPSWINLPYFDAENPDNPRKLLDHNGEHVDLLTGMQQCKAKKLLLKEHYRILNELPLNDAPPCLQTLFLLRSNITEGDFRNNFLFSMAVYYKLKDGDNWEDSVKFVNSSMGNPLNERELEATVLKSNRHRQYFYKCKDAPCSLYCQKQACYDRKFGIGSESNSGLNFEDLHQYLTDPPYYVWYVNGKPLRFFDEGDILTQTVFHKLCMRYLHVAPNKLKDASWRKIVNTALENVQVHSEEESQEISAGGMWWKYTKDFFLQRVLAATTGQLKIGRTYRDISKGCYIFSGPAYIEYIRNTKSFKMYSDVELQAKLKDYGAQVIMYEGLPYWSIPISKIDVDRVDINETPEETDIDFLDGMKQGDKY